MPPVGVRQVSRQFALCAGVIFDGAPGDHGLGPMRISLFNIVLPPPPTHTVLRGRKGRMGRRSKHCRSANIAVER